MSTFADHRTLTQADRRLVPWQGHFRGQVRVSIWDPVAHLDSQSWFSRKGSSFAMEAWFYHCDYLSDSCGIPCSLIWPVGTCPYPSWLVAPPGSQAQAGHKHKAPAGNSYFFNQRRLAYAVSNHRSRCVNQSAVGVGHLTVAAFRGADTRRAPCCSGTALRKWVAEDGSGQGVGDAEDEMMSGRMRSLNLQG